MGMNMRERYVATLTFGTPDRIPFEPGHGRESTRARWHREGLPEGVNPVTHAIEQLGIAIERPATPRVDTGIDFRLRPQFEEKVLSHRDGHLVVQDWKGNICEISDQYDVSYLRNATDFVTRRWIKCPVENRDDWDAMRTRYDAEDPTRLSSDIEDRAILLKDRDWPLTVSVSGPFWQLREWCGFEGLCMLMLDKRCMAAGGQKLKDEMQRIAPVVRDGGYIPSCDHGIPSDVFWPNFLDYCRQLAEITGWL